MRYEGHLKTEVHTSRIPLSAPSDDEAVEEFKRLRLAHGKSTVLSLKLIKISDDSEESEINVP